VTVTTAPPRIQDPAGAAITPATSLGIFRSCLAALSEPGRLARLDAPASLSPAVAILLALTDVSTPVAVLGQDAGAGDAGVGDAGLRRVLAASGAPLVDARAARYLLAAEEPDADELASVPLGTDLDPHLGALVVVGVDSLESGSSDVASTGTRLTLELTGPGVASRRLVRVAGLSRGFIDQRNSLVATPPRGIDLLLVTPSGDLVGLPRTTAITIQEASR
jgi:alpha-D-ribose 1-methylphosphonate 5-triphosphate synthase subunit PhnH